MDYDFTQTETLFKDFLEKRPEVGLENLKVDLERYYLPYVNKLIEIKKKDTTPETIIVGVSAIQGAGKTTQGEIMEILLDQAGFPTDSRSIDDHYITHRELCDLRQVDPRFIRRGVTHDIHLAIQDLKHLQDMESGTPIIVSGYDKGAHHGDGDRFRWINPVANLEVKFKVVDKNLTVNKTDQTVKAVELVSAFYNSKEVWLPQHMGSAVPLVEPMFTPEVLEFLKTQTGEVMVTEVDEDNVKFSGEGEINLIKKELPNGWRLVIDKPDFIFYDGWMLGVRSIIDDQVFDQDLPALETHEAKQFARDVNRKLLDYEKLWEMLDFLTVLYVKDYQISLKWRDQAEDALRAKGEGMSSQEIREFVYYFWRSVHPAIHIKNLSEDKTHTNQVVVINDDHSVGEITVY